MSKNEEATTVKPKYRVDLTATIIDTAFEREHAYSSIIRIPASLTVSINANDLFEAISVLDRLKTLVQPR